MKVNLLGIPTSDGTSVRGAEQAPRVLRELGLVGIIERYRSVRDLGDVSVPENEWKSENLRNSRIFNYDRVVDFNRTAADMAVEYAESADFTLFLGGDHSISAGSIAGLLYNFPETAVVWMDAHADLNTDETSPSKNAHGMPAAAILGYGDKRLRNIYGTRLPEGNLFLLGQRGAVLDEGEVELIKKRGIFLRTWEEMRQEGVTNVLEGIFRTIRKKGVNRVHLSFDIDVVCGSIVRGTGTAVDGGPDLISVKMMLRAFAGSGMLRSMDFVELNPNLDKDGSTARICLELIEEVFKYLV